MPNIIQQYSNLPVTITISGVKREFRVYAMKLETGISITHLYCHHEGREYKNSYIELLDFPEVKAEIEGQLL